ncbi:hypothetical protein Btru_069944 [Bulinus truncatus]|nr:hypothetical protein Btru_069944 [Bulinus truncatus]
MYKPKTRNGNILELTNSGNKKQRLEDIRIDTMTTDPIPGDTNNIPASRVHAALDIWGVGGGWGVVELLQLLKTKDIIIRGEEEQLGLLFASGAGRLRSRHKRYGWINPLVVAALDLSVTRERVTG